MMTTRQEELGILLNKAYTALCSALYLLDNVTLERDPSVYQFVIDTITNIEQEMGWDREE